MCIARLTRYFLELRPRRRHVCAWCPDFDPKTSAGQSHGMCQACSDRMIFEAVKRGQGGAR